MKFINKILGLDLTADTKGITLSAEQLTKLDAHFESADVKMSEVLQKMDAAEALNTTLAGNIAEITKSVATLKTEVESNTARLDKYNNTPAQTVTLSSVEPTPVAKEKVVEPAQAAFNKAVETGEPLTVTA